MDGSSSRLLDELKAHHARVAEAMKRVELILAEPKPDISILGIARVSLSQASSRRSRFLTDKIYPTLLAMADAPLRDQISRMSADFLEKRKVSSEHVVRWSQKAIEADWSGYRAASTRIRAMMKDRMDREISVLYAPLATHH